MNDTVANDDIATEFNRMLDSFSSIIDSQQRDLSRGMRVISQAFERAVERFSQTIADAPSMPSATLGGGGGSDDSSSSSGASSGGGTSSTGVMLVRVVNDDSNPVVTRKVSSGWDIFGGIMGGIGSLFGGILGGLFGGGIGLAVFGGSLVALGVELIIFADRLRDLLRDFRSFTGFLIGGLAWFLREFFGHLYKAGIFPVSRLIASLLLFIDFAITLVLMHITPYIDFVKELLKNAVDWLGRFINRLSNWLETLINRLAPFLSDFIDYLLARLARTFISVGFGIANMIFEVLKLAGEHLVHMLSSAFNSFVTAILQAFFTVAHVLMNIASVFAGTIQNALAAALNPIISALPSIPGVGSIPQIPTTTVPSLSDAVTSAVQSGRRQGANAASNFTISTTAPTRSFGDAASSGFRTGRTAGELLSDSIFGRPTRPNLDVPGFRSPRLDLPDTPQPSPQLRRLFQQEEENARTQQQLLHEQRHRDAGVTLNGDVNVDIRSETVDMENSDAIARNIAGQVLEEIRYLNNQERFSRGLESENIA